MGADVGPRIVVTPFTCQAVRQPQVTDVCFSGVVARAERRGDLVAVLTAIAEHGGEITPVELGEHLFGRPASAYGARFLHLAAERDWACEERGTWHLTDNGVSALADDVALAPESGIWRAQIIDDPL